MYFRIGDQNSQTASFTPKKVEDRIKAAAYYYEKLSILSCSENYRKGYRMAAFYYIFLSCMLWMTKHRNMYRKHIF